MPLVYAAQGIALQDYAKLHPTHYLGAGLTHDCCGHPRRSGDRPTPGGRFTLSLFSSQVQAAALDRRKRPVSMSLQPFIEFINGSPTLSL